MSNIRNSHAHDMMNESIQHFGVIFDYKATDLSREKEYTYKAKKGQYQAGDLAVVLVKNDYEDTRSNSYKVVRITREIALDEVNFQVNYDYGYIVSKNAARESLENIADHRAKLLQLEYIETESEN